MCCVVNLTIFIPDSGQQAGQERSMPEMGGKNQESW